MDAYRPVMYFVDNAFDGLNNPDRNVTKLGDEIGVPTTCEGDKVGAPIIDMNLEDCAQACDQALVHGCKGFQHFDNVGYGNKPATVLSLFELLWSYRSLLHRLQGGQEG